MDFSGSADPMRFTNHSCKPNARLCIRNGRVGFYALRAIASGEAEASTRFVHFDARAWRTPSAQQRRGLRPRQAAHD
jgi:hypothetical protein